MNTPRRKLTRRQAWRRLLKAFSDWDHTNELICDGICPAISYLWGWGEISTYTARQMWDDIIAVRPKSAIPSYWHWPLNASGARSRCAAISRILRRMK